MQESFYKDSIVLLEGVISEITARLDIIRKYKIIHNDRDPIEYITRFYYQITIIRGIINHRFQAWTFFWKQLKLSCNQYNFSHNPLSSVFAKLFYKISFNSLQVLQCFRCIFQFWHITTLKQILLHLLTTSHFLLQTAPLLLILPEAERLPSTDQTHSYPQLHKLPDHSELDIPDDSFLLPCNTSV